MNIRETIRPLFVARASSSLPSKGPQATEGPTAQPASPVFLTPQSLVTFPGAALAINILWNFIAVLSKDLAQMAIVPLGLALVIGAIIYVVSLSPDMSRKDKLLGGFVAFINAAWLGLNALGVDIVKAPVP
ncbi:MAG: hypothetical protein NZ528_06215 [Caldilineales bacterium]|nr:hypothetical protein [Caldilineales bacterium]MDW8318050.1 hypothetical protein [Anaerolineae bacterium]